MAAACRLFYSQPGKVLFPVREYFFPSEGIIFSLRGRKFSSAEKKFCLFGKFSSLFLCSIAKTPYICNVKFTMRMRCAD